MPEEVIVVLGFFDSDDSVLSKATTGPANVASDFERAIENLISSIRNALQQAGLNADAPYKSVGCRRGLGGITQSHSATKTGGMEASL